MPSIEDMSAARQRGAAADAMMEEALLAALPPQDIAAVNAQIRRSSCCGQSVHPSIWHNSSSRRSHAEKKVYGYLKKEATINHHSKEITLWKRWHNRLISVGNLLHTSYELLSQYQQQTTHTHTQQLTQQNKRVEALMDGLLLCSEIHLLSSGIWDDDDVFSEACQAPQSKFLLQKYHANQLVMLTSKTQQPTSDLTPRRWWNPKTRTVSQSILLNTGLVEVMEATNVCVDYAPAQSRAGLDVLPLRRDDEMHRVDSSSVEKTDVERIKWMIWPKQ